MKFLIFLLLLVQPLMAQQLTEFSEEGRSESTDSVQARQEIVQDAVEKVSMKLIRELIGDSKADRQLSSLKAKIISQYEKYIPFIKTGTPRVDGAQTRMNVIFKLDVRSLTSLLQKSGFMGAAEGAATLLPLVSFSDIVNRKAYRWWINGNEESNPFLKPQEKSFTETLKSEFSKLSFKILDPQSGVLRKQVPQALQIESLRVQDYQSIGEALKAQMILKGDVRFEEGKSPQTYKIVLKFNVLNVTNGRVVGDSIRTAETEAGPFSLVVTKKMSQLNAEIIQDLAAQVHEAWTRGTLSASLVRLSIKGNFDYKTLESIKEDIRTQVRSVRSLTERLFVRGQTEFDIDVEGGAEALAKGLGQVKWKSVQLRVDEVEAASVELR